MRETGNGATGAKGALTGGKGKWGKIPKTSLLSVSFQNIFIDQS